MNIHIDRQMSTPIYMQIKNIIKKQILSGELVSGFKLPPERELAKETGVHRNTIIRAYEELIKEELITSSVSPRGYFVTYSQQEEYKKVTGFSSRKYPGALSFMLKDEYLQMDTLFSELFYNDGLAKSEQKIISLAADIISKELYPRDQLNEIVKELSGVDGFDWYGFSPAQGLPELIASIQGLLKRRNIHVSSKEIQVVSETYEAIQFAAKIFLSSHDTIIAEEPISPDMLQAFQFMDINVITIPMDEEGMETRYLEGLIVKYRPKLIYTIPTFHFPTSSVLSLSRRYELLELSYKYDIPIIEEDCDSVIRYEGSPVPSLKALDTMGNVIYINSFIATICPGIRTAYMVAPEKITRKLSTIMENTQIFLSPLNQYIASQFISRGYIYDSIERICQFGRQNRDLLCKALAETEDIDYRFTVPKGGTSLWCRINENINPKRLLCKAHELGVSYMPGNLFFPFRSKGDNLVRLCYGNVSPDELTEGIERLSEAVRASRG